MAVNSAPSSGDFEKLKRFLYFGNESNCYEAGRTNVQNLSLATGFSVRAHVIYELLAAEKGEEMVEEISKFLSRNTLGVSRSPALYALAVCARHSDQTHKTKQAAMKVFVSEIDNSADLFTFIAYMVQLKTREAKEAEDGKHKGWGRSLKTAVQNWFDKRDAMTLARIVTQQKTACHWSYVDLLRLTHIMPKTEGAKMIAKYLVKGLKAAREEYGGEKENSDDTLQQALAYLAVVEQLKAMEGKRGRGGGAQEEGESAARAETGAGEAQATREEVVVDLELARALVEEHSLCLQQLVSRLQQAPEVLGVLVKQMKLQEVLENIGHLARFHMMDPTCPHVENLIKKVEDQGALKSIHPMSLLIAMEAYQSGAARRKWMMNSSFLEVLTNAFAHALKENVKPTSKRYLVAVNLNRRFLGSWAHGVRVLRPFVAAAGVCMYLTKNEKSVEVVAYDTEVKPVNFEDGWTVSNYSDAFLSLCNNLRPKVVADLTAPLTWANEGKKEFDVIIIMTDFRRPKPFHDFPETFRKYKEAAGMPKAKLITIGLTASSMNFSTPEEPGMLDIAGFNSVVPNLIQRFVTDTL